MSEMSLIAGAGEYCNWPKIESLLRLLVKGELHSLAQLETLSDKLISNADCRVILIYSDFSHALDQILQNESIDINEAIEEWSLSVGVLQDLYRTHRNQVLLFELNEVIANPQSFLETCWLKLGCEGPIPNYESSIKNESDLLTELWAQKWLAQNPLLNQVNQYTRAMAWPLVDASLVSELNAEQALTQLQYLFSFKAKHQQLLDEVNLLNSKVVQLESSENQLNLDKSLLGEENSLLLEQLHIAQEEIEAKSFSEKKLNEKITSLEEEKNDLEKKLIEEKYLYEKNKKETNSKLEVENKKINEFEKLETSLKNKVSNLLEENSLLLEQLHIVQEEIEKKFISEKETLSQLNKQQKEFRQLEFSVKELNDENTVLTKLLHSTQEQLQHVYLQQNKEADQTNNQDPEPPAVGTALVAVQESTSYLPALVASRPNGFLARRAIKKEKRRTLRMDTERAAILAQSTWFNKEWYLAQNPDIASNEKQAKNPALHYVRHGGFEGRNPSPHFDSAFYLAENPDVAESGMNPLWHFLQNGQAEGRQPHP